MARKRRYTPGGYVYHVCNRGSRKGVILETYAEYADFCDLLNEAREKYCMRIVAYNLVGNHFHLLLWPHGDLDVPRFMKRLEQRHAQRFHRRRGTVGCGAVFQNRYVSRAIDEDRKYIAILKYVEGNAARHRLVDRAEHWPWCSAWAHESIGPRVVLSDGPIPRLPFWLDLLNDF